MKDGSQEVRAKHGTSAAGGRGRGGDARGEEPGRKHQLAVGAEAC